MFIVVGVIATGALWWLGVDFHAALFALIAGVVAQSIPVRYVIGGSPRSRLMNHSEAQAWLRKEGHLGATSEVLAGERDAYDKAAREIAAAVGQDEYTDSCGNRRSVRDL